MATPTNNKPTSYEKMIQAYDQWLRRGYFLFSDDGSGDGSDNETWDDDDDFCNEVNCC